MAGASWNEKEEAILRSFASKSNVPTAEILEALRGIGSNRSANSVHYKLKNLRVEAAFPRIKPTPRSPEQDPREPGTEPALTQEEEEAQKAERGQLLLLKAEVKKLKKRALEADLYTAVTNVIREVAQGLAALPPLPDVTPVQPRMQASPQEACLILSDWHTGEKVSLEVTQGANEYDLDIFSRRLRTVIETTIDLLAFHRLAGEMDNMVVFLLGDMVSGLIHEELLRGSPGVPVQVMCAAHGAAQAIRHLAAHCTKIRVRCIVGNHGRTRVPYEFKDPTDSFDWLVYEVAQILTRELPNVEWEIHNAWGGHVDVMGHTIAYFHGDGRKNAGGYAGIPFYALANAATAAFRHYVTRLDVVPELLLQGHLHFDAVIPGMPKIMINSSLKGSDELAGKTLFNTISPARQQLFGVSEARVLTFNYPIDAIARDRKFWIPTLPAEMDE
jgi:hypothetical protein